MNKIRKISIGSDYKNDAMHYSVGQEVYGGHVISDILFQENNGEYLVYIQKNKETLPFSDSVFHGQTPLRDPAINPTIIDIVIDLNLLRRVLKILDKKTKPQTDPIVKKSITFNK